MIIFNLRSFRNVEIGAHNHIEFLYASWKNETEVVLTSAEKKRMNVILDAHSGGRRDLVVTFLVHHPKAILLLWTARKRAQEIGGSWRVVYVDEPRQHNNMTRARHEQILHLLTRAKQMGAETEHVEAQSLLRGMEETLKRDSARIDTVIIGSMEREHRLFKYLYTPMWVKQVELASAYNKVETIPLTGQFQQQFYVRAINYLREVQPKHLGYALLAMVVPYAIAALMQASLSPVFFRINEENIDNLFLITAAIVAGRFGLIPGLVAAIAGFFVHHYFFSLPYNQLKLHSVTDYFGMMLFLSAAALIAVFTSQMRDYAQKIKKREMHTEILFTLYRLTSEAFSREQALDVLQKNLEQMLKCDVALFLPPAGQPSGLQAAAPEEIALDDNDRKALAACWSDMKSTGAASPYNPGSEWRFEPMIAASGEVGVLGIRPHDRRQLDAWFGRLLTATADQTAAILSHIELERSMQATRISEEREKLRVMLLSSVSHDLKTPLAGIIGALSAYNTLGPRLKPDQQQELLDCSLEEAQRLDSLITNILDMTRLEAGNIKFHKDWINIRDVTEGVIKRLAHRIKNREVVVSFPPLEIEAYMDNIMTGQVLQNLIDNACKYTPLGSRIDIIWETDDEGIFCKVRDRGHGIPPEKLDTVFDKYTRLQKQDTQTPGTGLGLAIARTVMEGQGGWIRAENHPDGGAIFTFFIPQWRSAATAIAQKEKAYATLQ